MAGSADSPSKIPNHRDEGRPATLEEALRLHQAGDFQAAHQLYQQILMAEPERADALHLLGLLYLQTGNDEEAVRGFSRAIEINPADPAYHSNLAIALVNQGKIDEAEASLRKAVELNPGYAKGHNNLGNVLMMKGELAEALGNYEKATGLDPAYADAHNNLGNALYQMEREEEAVSSYRRALEISPGFADAHAHLGLVYRDRGMTKEASTHFRKELESRPSDGARIKLALLLPPIYQFRDDILSRRTGLEGQIDSLLERKIEIHDPVKEVGLTNFDLAYQNMNDRGIQEKLGKLYASLAKTYPCERPRRNKIRIGFISNFFKNHTIGKYFIGMIEKLSREKFEVVVLSISHHKDEIGRRFKDKADDYVCITSNWKIAHDSVESRKLDVLFFTDISMDAVTYFLALSRFAPVQCVTWGHPDTTGIGNVDYFLSSQDLETEGADNHYSEELVRAENVGTYFYRPEPRGPVKSRADFGLPDDRILYLCPQTLFKFHPDFDLLLGEILRRDPRAELVLVCATYPQWGELLMGRFRSSIPDVTGRMRILPRQDETDFFQLMALSDVLLDTIYFTGGVSSYEAFSLGVPIVTMPSGFMRGRMTYALYRKMGVMDCVARTPKEYIEIALRLGTDPDWRRAVREKILGACDVLFENIAAVRELENFFVKAVETARGK